MSSAAILMVNSLAKLPCLRAKNDLHLLVVVNCDKLCLLSKKATFTKSLPSSDCIL